jgi:HD-GYP domain-containing protein (c-di-GMP phosphodiesterase class II)
VAANGKALLREANDFRTTQGNPPVKPPTPQSSAIRGDSTDSAESKDHGHGRHESSAVALLMQARRRLELSCASIGTVADFPAQIADIRRLVVRACSLSQEVALAATLLQVNGRYSIRHSVDVAVACQVVGTVMQLPEPDLASIVSAGLTMNVSMLELQDVMHVQRQPLTDLQRRTIDAHPQKSEELLRRLGVADDLWLNAVRLHHEALDRGSSAQAGAGDSLIRFAAELIVLADVYCARISARTDRRAAGSSAVLKTFLRDEGNKISSGLASCFIKAVGVFPPGTPVKLQNGEIAVVTGRGDTPSTPRVCGIVDPSGMPRLVPVRRDTDKPQFSVREVLEWSAVGTLPSMELLWGRVAADA